MEKVDENEKKLDEMSAEKEPEEKVAVEAESTEVESVETDSREEEHPADSSKKGARELIEEAREMVHQSDSVVKDCMEILDEDMEEYEEAKEKIIDGSLQTTEELLGEIGFEPEVIEDISEEHIEFENVEPIEPMDVKNLSSGRFGAFLLALIAGLAVAAGWIYAATEKLGITLDISKIPSKEIQEKILSWIGGGITGGEGNTITGVVILGVSAFVVMLIVYKIRVYLKEIHNQRVAEKINEEAKFYCTKKEECKKEMEKISEHIHSVIDSLKTYDIFFDELNAKMRRILHIEGKVPFNEYHPKSKEEIKRANTLINSFKELVTTPMAGENGSLSEEAKKALEHSGRTLDLHREKLYL